MPKQKTSIFTTGTPAIEFTAPDQRWKIEEGVLVRTEGASAVRSEFNDSTLVNKGAISGEQDIGVRFLGEKNFTLLNKASGTIFGAGTAVRVEGAFEKNMVVENAGTLFGAGEFGVLVTSAKNFHLTNTGEIFGAENAIHLGDDDNGTGDDPLIENAGLIHSDFVAIRSYSSSALTTTVINQKGGTIEGETSAIEAVGSLLVVNEGTIEGEIKGFVDFIEDAGSKQKIVNEGKIDGTVRLGAGDDKVVNEGEIDGNVQLGTGEDTVVNEGEIDGNVFLGDGEDTYENDGGKAGKVFGGEGKDKLIAGKSKDEFVFQAPDSGVDRVKNFESGKDKFFLDNAFFGDLPLGPLAGSAFEKGTEADDANDRIIYDKDTGKLYFDADGDGDAGQIKFAKLDAGTKLKADDFEVLLLV